MTPIESVLVLRKLADRAAKARNWEQPMERIDQLNDVLMEIFANEIVSVLRERYVPINRQNLKETVASNLGLNDPGQPAASISEIEFTIDKMLEQGKLIEREADCPQPETGKFYVIELPLLDRLAAEA